MTMRRSHLALFLLFLTSTSASELNPAASFVAGSFVITQKSLNEAPFRYAGVLRRALDRMETLEPPSKSDEEHCDVRYRIRPSGRRSRLEVRENSLSIRLRSNSSVVFSASLDVSVAVRTWIWKGIDLGFVGCLKVSSCNGQIVTYTAHIDLNVELSVLYIDKRLRIHVKPVDTELHDVSVKGCRPPWYLWWFKKWQALLNHGVQSAFQEFADTYEHQSELPSQVSPVANVFVHYVITDLVWTEDYVAVMANATFSAAVSDTRNVTFVPDTTNNDTNAGGFAGLPSLRSWPMSSPWDASSHLLQGLRLSSQFVNGVMWFASQANLTEYNGSAHVLDSEINGSIWYTPPEVRVDRADRLDIRIERGLLMATCLPLANSSGRSAAILFKAEFANVWGTGHINLAATKDQTGLKVSLDGMDVSRMNTKPFEPKLPLPESFENELMRSAVAHLQPLLNRYLDEKPINLPDNIKPFAAAPQLKLVGTGNGLGYAEILSYCTCSKQATKFAQCDPRSHICHTKSRRSDESIEIDDGVGVLSGFREQMGDGLRNIMGMAEGVLSSFNFSEPSETILEQDVMDVRAEVSAVGDRNISYEGVFVTVYESNKRCELNALGDSAKVYWLWRSNHCSAIFVEGKESKQFYRLDANQLRLMCSDNSCENCLHTVHYDDDEECHEREQVSFAFKQPDLSHFKHGAVNTNVEEVASANVIASVFFNDHFCSFLPLYLQPQLVSTHTKIGLINQLTECQHTFNGQYISSVVNDSVIESAAWECGSHCTGCLFRVHQINITSCFSFQTGIRLRFDQTLAEDKMERENATIIFKSLLITSDMTLVLLLTLLLVVVVVALLVILLVMFKLRSRKTSSVTSLSSSVEKSTWRSLRHSIDVFKAWIHGNMGLRLNTWRRLENKERVEDVVQNLFLLINASMALVFTYKWQGDNNPLLIVQSKLNGSWSRDLLDTEALVSFSSTLSLFTSTVNLLNVFMSLLVFVLWLFSVGGKRRVWIVLRLLSALSLVSLLFVVLSTTIFSTYLDTLIQLRRSTGMLVTDNESLHSVTSSVLQVAQSGFALTLLSFVLVFLFHGVGGGLFCGSVLFRLLHLHSKVANLELMTTLMVILTIIQPFISLHPVIILAQDSNHNSLFLSLTILVWLLPLLIHSVAKLLPNSSSLVWSMFIAVSQLTLFVASFMVVTFSLVSSEFNQERQNVRDFVLPAIASVFLWTTSISYFLLALVMEEGGSGERRLVFKDQNLDEARRLVREALEKRLANLDARCTSRPRPHRPAPPPPTRTSTTSTTWTLRRSSLMSPRDDQVEEDRRCRQALKSRIEQLHETLESRQDALRMHEVRGERDAEEVTPLRTRPTITTKAMTKSVHPIIDVQVEVNCGLRLWHFLIEQREYKDPMTYGWRIRYRRLFLLVGILVFCSLTLYTVIDAQSFSSKSEIQKLLDHMHLNLTWPDSGSLLDDLFLRYNEMERLKSYLMLVSCVFFVTALLLDFSTQLVATSVRRQVLFTGSRVATFAGSLIVFASVIVVGVPDYLAVSHLDTLSPFCGEQFNRTVKQASEFAIGLFFACLFTFQLLPILITIAPALVRASVLILVHPSLQLVDVDNGLSLLRMSILQQVVQFAALLAFPITFVSMAIVQQIQKDVIVSWLIVAFWLLPPFVLFVGLRVTRRLKRFTILLYVYYLYNCCYFLLLLALGLYAFKIERALDILADLVVQPSFWASSISQISLCNVVISDLLYMTVF